MRYYIRKSTRNAMNQPYAGGACQKVGVEPGKWYDDKIEAQIDAAKLTQENQVGFVVEAASIREMKHGMLRMSKESFSGGDNRMMLELQIPKERRIIRMRMSMAEWAEILTGKWDDNINVEEWVRPAPEE